MNHLPPSSCPDPKTMQTGRQKRLKRGQKTPEVIEKLRQYAFKNKPWLHSTGPRTAEGKTRSAANVLKRRKAENSVRRLRAEVAQIGSLIKKMTDARLLASKATADRF